MACYVHNTSKTYWNFFLLISSSTMVRTNAKGMPFGPYVKDPKYKSGNKSLCLHHTGVSINTRYIIGNNTCSSSSSSSNRMQRILKREAQGLKQLSTYHTKISAVSIVYYTWHKQDSPATHTHTQSNYLLQLAKHGYERSRGENQEETQRE